MLPLFFLRLVETTVFNAPSCQLLPTVERDCRSTNHDLIELMLHRVATIVISKVTYGSEVREAYLNREGLSLLTVQGMPAAKSSGNGCSLMFLQR